MSDLSDTAQAYSSDPSWLLVAAGEVGVKEIMGIKHNPKILKYHDYTELDASSDEVPWCSSFVNWCFAEVGLQGTNKATARSWLDWGQRTIKPTRGSVVVLSRGKSTWQGHVGFYVGHDEAHVLVLGGNQKNAVNITAYSMSRVIGFRDPIIN